MKKTSWLMRMFPFLFAALIVAMGALIPKLVFARQEKALLTDPKQYAAVSKEPISVAPTPTPAPLPATPEEARFNSEMLMYRLVIWQQGGRSGMDEPQEGELTMEEAVKTARAELERLVILGALPEKTPYKSCVVQSAALYRIWFQEKWQEVIDASAQAGESSGHDSAVIPKSADGRNVLGRWEIRFADDAQQSIEVTIDAQTGRIYRADISLSTEGLSNSERESLENLPYHEMLLMFARYHGLLKTNDWLYSESERPMLEIGNFQMNYVPYKAKTETQVSFMIEIQVK